MNPRRVAGVAVVIAVLDAAVLGGAVSSTIADAAMAGDAAAVRAFLKAGSDVNMAQADGMTALHWAASHGDAELTGILLHAGGNVRATSRLGAYTALHLASESGTAAVVDALIDFGSGVDTPTATGATPLMLAAAAGNIGTVTALLAHGANPDARENGRGETALMFAAALDRAAVVETLVDDGADTALVSSAVDISIATPPEERLQNSIREAQAAGGAGGASGRAARAPEQSDGRGIAGITRAFTFSELIGRQGGLTALHFAARQGHQATVRARVDLVDATLAKFALLRQAGREQGVDAEGRDDDEREPQAVARGEHR